MGDVVVINSVEHEGGSERARKHTRGKAWGRGMGHETHKCRVLVSVSVSPRHTNHIHVNVEAEYQDGAASRRKRNMHRQQPTPPIHDRLQRRRDLLPHHRRRLMKLQTPHQRRQNHLKLKHRQAVPNAIPRPVAERHEPAPPVRERAGRGDTVCAAGGGEPALGAELRGGGAPDGGVHVHGREGDVEDLPGFDADGGERFAGGRDDGLAERDDVVTERDALCLRRGGVQAEAARRRGRGRGGEGEGGM